MTDATSSDPPQGKKKNDLTGRALGDYRLLRRLGQGAMAEVYLAEQLSLGRQVALKVLKAELATDATYLRRFELEARAAASLVHTSIVQIYEVGCIDGIHFITQEYVQGQNLGELLRRQNTLPLPQVVGILRQVAAALAKADEHGIVHRDIKPENLMLSRSGEVKVADFGLARVTEGNDQQKLTRIGITMGSPLYMSPEQAEGKPLDTRSDIYSLGATCYEMLVGRPPFQGETALAVAVQHVKSEPTRLETLRSDLPAELCQLVHRMLAKTPAERQKSGTELLRELRRLPIEQPEGDWPDALDSLNTTESVALSTARQAATQHLSLVMRESATPRPVYRHPLVWIGAVGAIGAVVALLLGALLLGGWLAIPADEVPLLDDSTLTANAVQQRNTAQQQYVAALQANTEAALRSVEKHFPADARYVDLARRQLAIRYLDQNRVLDAQTIFDVLALRKESGGDDLSGDESDRNLRYYGLAGQYVVLSLLEDDAAAAEKLTQLVRSRAGEPTPLERLLDFDRTMAERVAKMIRVGGSGADSQEGTAKAAEAWLQRYYPAAR